MLDLDAIEARANAATPGATMAKYAHGGGRLAIWGDDERKLVADVFNEADRDFFEHAREDVAAMAREIRRLRAALEKVAANDLSADDMANEAWVALACAPTH